MEKLVREFDNGRTELQLELLSGTSSNITLGGKGTYKRVEKSPKILVRPNARVSNDEKRLTISPTSLKNCP